MRAADHEEDFMVMRALVVSIVGVVLVTIALVVNAEASIPEPAHAGRSSRVPGRFPASQGIPRGREQALRSGRVSPPPS